MPAVSIFSRRHAGRATKCSRKTRLRREARVQDYLCKRHPARCYFRHRVLQPHPTDIAVGRDADGEREHAREMERAETRDPGQLLDRDLISNMFHDVIENTAQPHMVELMRSRRGERTRSAVAV